MAEKPKQPPSAPVILSVNCLVDGKFFTAGSEVPFTAETLPEHLRAFIATGEEPPFYSHQERLIYDTPQTGHDPGVVFQATGGQQWVQGQARQTLAISQEQIWAEAQAEADGQLPKETQEALEDAHAKYSALAMAQLAAHQRFTDAVYEDAERQVEEKQTQFYVKRGGAWGKVQNATLKPGEVCFVKRPNGQYEVSGYIDSDGQPPDPEITT